MPEPNPYAAPNADVAVSEPNELAGRGARLGGAIIDGVIISLAVWLMMFVSGYLEKVMAGEQSIADTILLGLGGIGIFLAFNGYLLAKHGQTIGKRLVRTRIVSIKDDSILPFGRVVGLRYLPLWIIGQVPLLGPLISLIDSLFIFRKDRRCLHDHLAGTRVVTASLN